MKPEKSKQTIFPHLDAIFSLILFWFFFSTGAQIHSLYLPFMGWNLKTWIFSCFYAASTIPGSSRTRWHGELITHETLITLAGHCKEGLQCHFVWCGIKKMRAWFLGLLREHLSVS